MVLGKADILVVDDKPENLKLVVQLLSKEGYIVRPATSGKLALKAMDNLKPDLVLLDVSMPELNGYEVCEIIKKDDQLKDIPIIFLSALTKTSEKVKGFEVGGVDYISKPFQADELIERVKTHLEVKKQHQTIVEKKQVELDAEVTKRVSVEKTLEGLFRNFATVIDDVFFIVSPDYRNVVFVSPLFEKFLERPAEEFLGDSADIIDKLDSLVHPEDIAINTEIRKKRISGDYSESADYRILRPDGSIRWVTSHLFPILDNQGKLDYFVRLFKDITERKKLEIELLQSQKMEAIGQMTGGIAHDFNNLLAVILGNLILLEMDMEEGKEITNKTLKNLIGEAIEAGRMGADLTKKLLTFSRKTSLQAKNINLNQIVEKVEKLIIRTLPGNITLKTDLKENHKNILADSAFLESAIINLVINASDAMPKGGEIIIETGKETFENDFVDSLLKLNAGDYVTLSVIDTGCGMDSVTLEKVFDPFFTTKELGKGTGLGLSVVYGFVTQSGGGISIKSELDKGTTVKIYLPKAKPGVPDIVDKKTIKKVVAKKKSILVVEDEDGVRNFVMRTLERQGYNVLGAVDGETALEIIKSNKKIDLLLTDIILSGVMNGYELAKMSKDIREGMKILCMSGYFKNSILDGDESDYNFPLIEKPFSPKELTYMILELFEN